MKQSEARAPRRPGLPASFGRAETAAEPEEDFTIRGGQALHLVLHVNLTPDAESLAALREAIRETTRMGVLDGYAAALADMDAAAAEQQPGGADGGAPPGDPAAG